MKLATTLALAFATAGHADNAEKSPRLGGERKLFIGGNGNGGCGSCPYFWCKLFYPSTKYKADLGSNGAAWLEITNPAVSCDSFRVTVFLKNLGDVNLGNVDELAYHLHSGPLPANLAPDGYAARAPGTPTDQNEPACAATSGHYDPLFGCGPESTLKACTDTNNVQPCCDVRPAVGYCDTSPCEVGDLSGLFGKIDVNEPYDSNKYTGYDIRDEFLDGGAVAYDTWASIVFYGQDGKRVLCGNFAQT